ncbi:hypothetical protein [Sphingomonas sp. GC_Shp_4]|uniref:hypothetical protein n=1 Tax=Sphingomonas sp. GC_Shp_4 TaxID=2937382 RepID=UPI00226B9FB2|nr:hypothetical protein [Sphingomonas sp. GC_Shp_4]
MLGTYRLQAADLLGEYQLFKHRMLFDPAFVCSRRSQAARGLKVECILMGECFSAFHARWQHSDPGVVWPMFKADVIAVTDQLLKHLQIEQVGIDRLLNGG